MINLVKIALIAALALAVAYPVNPVFQHVAAHHTFCGTPTTAATFTRLHAVQKTRRCVYIASFKVETITPVVTQTPRPTSTPVPPTPVPTIAWSSPTPVPATPAPTDTQHLVLDLINSDRAQYGRRPLALISDATTQQHAVDMASIGTIFHQDAQFPNESFPYPQDNTFWGENVGAGTPQQVDSMMMAELGTPPNPGMCATGVVSHACNIISSSFTQVAIGVATGSPYGTYLVEDFR